ncbi:MULTISPECIES: lipocalin family protein [Pedobacter]|uniref:lipocalin family protein n=1 Tax=Pedobacter TaxID=84567 RepID=UPI00210C5E8C|nr:MULTISPECIES: lipocalin family protein [unclassified Pedobacter]
MKRIVLLAAIICSSMMVLQSCSPKGTNTTVKRGNITGSWVLNDITFEGVPQSAVKSLFDEGPHTCFIGSTWRLTNSGNGTYTLPGGSNCAAKTQNIYWSASPADQTFQFKKLNEGEKARDISSGYRTVLASADGNTMVIKSPVEYGSGAAYIVLNFSKAAN